MVDAGARTKIITFPLISFYDDRVIEELLKEIRQDIGSLYKLRELVCQLDVIVSLSQVSLNGGFCRPSFGPATLIRDGRHPILDRFASAGLVSNDTVNPPLLFFV